jgi:glucose-1-phosphate cytidylyltransferase
MKVVLLAGGLGTRLQEETVVKPKPMVEIGGRPMLWHVMKIYSTYGFREFVVALGYKGEYIKDYFLNYRERMSDLSICLKTGQTTVQQTESEDWMVHLVDTGLQSLTGGRVKRAAKFVGKEPFMMTYGDGVCNIDIPRLLAFHRSHGKLATVTAVRQPARFGDIICDGPMVQRFEEKSQVGGGWINGGFFVLEPEVVEYIDGDLTVFEREPLERLAAEGQLAAYFHDDFWQCMDTLRDVRLLEELWQSKKAPWQMWQ